MSDDRFEDRTAPQWRKSKEVAQTVFDRAQKAKYEKGVDADPPAFCATCSNTGMEIVMGDDGYNTARRCTQCGDRR